MSTTSNSDTNTCSSESESESEDESEMRRMKIRKKIYQQYMYAAFVAANHFEKYLMKSKRKEARVTGQQWVYDNLGSSKDCYKMFRMHRPCFDALHETLVQDYGLRETSNMCSEEALGMFLWTVGSPQSVSQVQNRFKRSTETINRKFNHVLKCLNLLAEDIIRPVDPRFRDVHKRLQDARFCPHFNNAIGAIDGTHVPVIVTAKDMINHVDRHGYATQNVMAVCDFDMRFISVVAGWPGSAHDTRIFKDTLDKYKTTFPHPPPGKYYLVDSGYPNQTGYLGPFRKTKYHLPEFRDGPAAVGRMEMFNYLHSSLRNVIERCFAVLKQKWRILKAMPSYPPRKKARIIIACLALHNFIRDSDLYDYHFARCDADEDYIPPGHEVNNGGGNYAAGPNVSMDAICDSIADAIMAA
ncbi:unnamed protein product [Alopecurus aequalis]